MNYALIFAGGTGQRMNSRSKPKQFLELNGKAIIVSTVLNFEHHSEVDEIIVVCIPEWIDYCWNIFKKEGIKKVKWIVPGGKSGQESIYNGIKVLIDNCQNPKESLVLINDGVRPIVSQELISRNIDLATRYGSAATSTYVTETILIVNHDGRLESIPDRTKCMLSKAPQTFVLDDIYNAHTIAIKEQNFKYTNSAELMNHYGFPIYIVEDTMQNIKITTPVDFYLYRAIISSKEDKQLNEEE